MISSTIIYKYIKICWPQCLISNFIIIVKALIDGKYFLAIINTITTIISIIFTLHIVDLGLIFKIFYYYDVTSYKNELNKLEKDKDKTLQYKNNLDQVVKFSETNNENSKNNFNKELLDNKSIKPISAKDQVSNKKSKLIDREQIEEDQQDVL